MSHHFVRSVGAAASILQLTVPTISLTAAQGFGPRSAAASTYRVVVVHDHLIDSTRLSASFTSPSPSKAGRRAGAAGPLRTPSRSTSRAATPFGSTCPRQDT